MVDLAPQAALQTEAAARPSIRRYYVLALLTVIYALNFLDRTIFNVLIEPIKKEFALSDTTMGLLAGFGFVLFYSLLGIPIARLADRFNRRNIVAVALAFWSAMTVFCGMAQSVTTLALARIGVGIGESGGTPASQSIIADLFSKNERPRALGIYAIGTYLGRQAEHAGAGVGIHAADGCRFRTRHRPAGRRHAQRRAEERFWR